MADVLRLAADEVDVSDVLLGVRAGPSEDLRRVVDGVAGLNSLACDPTSSMTPETSWPMMAGSCTEST
jgi:hypothetical protein